MRRICKECGEEYYVGSGAGLGYRKHNHGKNHPCYGRRGKLSSLYRRKFSKEHRRKLSLSQKGKNNSMYGVYRKHTKEVRKKISDSKKQLWLDGVYKYNNYSNTKWGHRKDLKQFFRSTWEANFARVLKYLKIPYRYEWKRFNTSYGSYTPDFYIPSRRIYVEVKGWENPKFNQKVKRNWLRNNCGVVVVMIRKDKYLIIERIFSKLLGNWES